MKKILTLALSIFPVFVFGKELNKEDIDNFHKYVMYESIYFNMRPAEVIGLHCLSAKTPSNTLSKMYPNLKDEAFSKEKLNKKICEIAMEGLLSFEEIERYTNEMKQEYNQKNP